MSEKQGYIDSCQQADVTGWAVENGAPALLYIEFDGHSVGTCQCDISRSDIAALGYPNNCGFVFKFPSAASASVKEIAVKFCDGTPLGNSPSAYHTMRVARLLTGIDPQSAGLEFGALAHPFLPKPQFNVFNVDHATRQDLLTKYGAHEPGALDRTRIVETDFVWTPGNDLRAVTGGRLFHYAIASHVIEHVADPIGWLAQISSVLVKGSRINLAVPEKTRTFDHLRPLSTAADMLEAYRSRLTKPTFRHVFGQLLGMAESRTPAEYKMAYDMAARAESAYLDAHCHVWTYASFLDCWQAIDALGILPLKLADSWEPITGANEFIVSFETI